VRSFQKPLTFSIDCLPLFKTPGLDMAAQVITGDNFVQRCKRRVRRAVPNEACTIRCSEKSYIELSEGMTHVHSTNNSCRVIKLQLLFLFQGSIWTLLRAMLKQQQP